LDFGGFFICFRCPLSLILCGTLCMFLTLMRLSFQIVTATTVVFQGAVLFRFHMLNLIDSCVASRKFPPNLEEIHVHKKWTETLFPWTKSMIQILESTKVVQSKNMYVWQEL